MAWYACACFLSSLATRSANIDAFLSILVAVFTLYNHIFCLQNDDFLLVVIMDIVIDPSDQISRCYSK